MKRWLGVALLSAATSVCAAADDAVVAKYNRSCISCHGSGAANAPRTGNVQAWAPRLAKGMDVLVAHSTAGFNAMPPKGLCMDCTPADYQALIEYMSTAK
jgi:cytochrome c5